MTDPDSAPPAKPGQTQADVVVSEFLVADSVEFHYSGPLPPASELEAYGRISADVPDRIVSMTESSLAHQQSMDQGHAKRSYAGLVAGFVVAVMFLGVAGWLISSGHDIAGTILGSVDLVGLTAVFVLGYRNGRRAG